MRHAARRWAAGVTVLLTVALLLPAQAAAAAPAAASRAAAGSAPATVAVELSAAPVVEGAPLTATVTVTAAHPSDVPSGTVQFTVDGATYGAQVELTGGKGTTAVSGLAVGAHAVGARYSGDGTFAAADAGPGATEVVVPAGTTRFVGLQPARILDTRPDRLSGYAGGKPAAGATVTLQVTGRGGVPATGATAVALNVTAVAPAARGYVTVWPTDQPRPVASNLNIETAGQVIPNLVVVPLSGAGRVNLYTTSSLHLVADVAGYFTGALTATAGRLVPLSPARLLDTRSRIGYSGSKPAAGTTVTLKVADRGGVPAAGVGGVVLNVTATNSAPGYVTVWPGDRPRPTASNLNISRANGTISNAVWVPLAPDGTVKLYVAQSTHLVADVTGWFTGPAAADSTAGLFVPTRPTRLLETRPGHQIGYSGGKPAAGATVPVRIAGRDPVPATGAAAVVANVTATETASSGYVTAYPAGTARPVASSLNLESAGQTRPNLVTTRLGDGSFNLYTTVATHLLVDVAGYFTPELNPAEPVTQRESYQPASGTTVLEPTSVSAVTGDAASGYTLTLSPGAPRPTPGAGVVLKGDGAAYPEGLAGTAGTVTSGADGTTTVTVTPAPLDRLFTNLDIGYDGPVDMVPQNAITPAARQGAPAQFGAVTGSTSIDHSIIKFGPQAFRCTVADGVEISVALVRFENTRVHFEQRTGLFTTPFLSFWLQTEPVVEFSAAVQGKVTCALTDAFRRDHKLTWVLPTQIPVTVDLGPAFQFEATVAGKVTFTQHFYRMVGVSTNPDLSVRVYNAGSQAGEGVSITGELSASLLIGADVSVKVLGVAGLGVTLGPKFTASVDTKRCVALTVGIHADFDVRFNAWIKEFRYTFLSFDLGPWNMYYRCPDTGGGTGPGGGPLTVRTTTLSDGTAGQPYRASLSANGGTAPYAWQVTGLPPGITANAGGHLGGTPTEVGSASISVTVTDAKGKRASGQVALRIADATAAGPELISVARDGGPANGYTYVLTTGADARYVYFQSDATDLTGGASGRDISVYVRDRTAGTTRRIDLPGDTGPVNKLLGTSSNGRFALVSGGGEPPFWRYDVQAGTAMPLPFGNWSNSDTYSISNDGDLVNLGGVTVHRISDGTQTVMTCPDGRNLFFRPMSVRFAGDGPAVYFTADDCGQYQISAFRFDRATGTTAQFLAPGCWWNSGNTCVEQVVPSASDAHTAIVKLTPAGTNIAYTLLLDRVEIPSIVGEHISACGVADNATVVFNAPSNLLAGGSPEGGDVFAYRATTGEITRVSPVATGYGEGSSACSDRGFAAETGQVVYVHQNQAYLNRVP
ncbi:Ig-like domain-containing protein [Micromonospora purpureochromogenes]|uniref:Ig-like domain-containing protein n=1 Tax=Micromonospora purpureochromogenes TaxID=47872 RepID=UPI0033F5A157